MLQTCLTGLVNDLRVRVVGERISFHNRSLISTYFKQVSPINYNNKIIINIQVVLREIMRLTLTDQNQHSIAYQKVFFIPQEEQFTNTVLIFY